MRRLRRVVADVGRKPGFGPTNRRSRSVLGARRETSRRRAFVAPRFRPLLPPGFARPRAAPEESARQPPAVSLIEPPSDAMWPAVPCRCVCPGSAITALRHWVAWWRLTSALPTTPRHARQGTGQTLARRHDSRTTDFLTRSLTAAGLDAAFAACHYPLRRATSDMPFRPCDVLRRGVVTGGGTCPATTSCPPRSCGPDGSDLGPAAARPD